MTILELMLVLIPAFLFLGAALNGAAAIARIYGKEISDRLVSIVGVASPVAAFICSLQVFLGVDALPGAVVENTVFQWFSSGSLTIDLAFSADHLTCVMLLVVTGVGSLIHVYSIGYMKGDEAYARYFSHLNLFMGFMSLLVLGSNLVVMFVGWEGVGLCSYLLIGFWWKDAEKAAAGMKAFIVNRIGDAAFLIGMFYLFNLTGTLDFGELKEWFGNPVNQAAALEGTTFLGGCAVTIIALLLFTGATGKSAQIPLYVWLPDAMAGPTPVSALIHAATMVTAGVYLIARMNFLYALSPVAQGVILVIGGSTCLFAGIMGLVQFDIKRVLAYSTISQIGYMFIGVGTGHIGTGVFHLTTHAFFKACLFLGAGSVIAMCHHEQDMRKMGGLGRRMPWTCAVMAISAASMAGVPPLSGFFSKDEILWRAFSTGTATGKIAWALGFMCAGLTAFYMFRLIFMVFTGTYRGDHPPHEAPRSMVAPKQVLALGAVVVGFLGIPHILGGHDTFGTYVMGIVPEYAKPAEHGSQVVLEWSLMIWSVVIGLIGIGIAWWFYIRRPKIPGEIAERFPKAYALVSDNFRVDEAYSSLIVKPVTKVSKSALYDGVDQGFIEGIINGLARLFTGLSFILSRAQGGVVRSYVALMVAGTLLLLLLTMLQ